MPLPTDYHMHPQGPQPSGPIRRSCCSRGPKAHGKRSLKEIAFTDHDRYHEGV